MVCLVIRDGPLENLWGAGEVQKKYSPKGKLNDKNSCTPTNPKKYSCHGLKKIHTRNLMTKKIPAAQKFPTPARPHPPITFLMVRPLVFPGHRSFHRTPSDISYNKRIMNSKLFHFSQNNSPYLYFKVTYMQVNSRAGFTLTLASLTKQKLSRTARFLCHVL